MKKTLMIVIGSALLTAAGILAEPALAADLEMRLVATRDLDLANAAGRRVLDRRIVRAAHDVCGGASDADLRGKRLVRECRVGTLAAARAKRDRLLALGDRGAVVAVTAAR